jgi:DnaK suppressor protein
VRRERSRADHRLRPGDYVDMARSSADVETHAGLIARAEEKLKYLDEAISQLEAGTYGSCVGCHRPIAIERLIAVPFALYCLSCQRRRKPSQDTWSRGGTIAPYDQLWTPPDENEGGAEHGIRRHDPGSDGQHSRSRQVCACGASSGDTVAQNLERRKKAHEPLMGRQPLHWRVFRSPSPQVPSS